MEHSLKILSAVVFAILVAGFLNRKRVKIHVPMMVSAFVIDVAMVLYIELNRHAIKQAIGPTPLLMKVHILLSLITVVLYVGQIVTGIKKAQGKPTGWHGKAGPLLLLARFGNLVTSCMIV